MVQLHTQKCLSVGHPELKKKKRKQALRRIDNTSAFITHHGYRAQTLNYSLKFLQTSLQLSILQDPAVCKSRSNTDLKKQHWSHIFFWQFLKVNSWSKNALLYMTGQYSLLHSKLDISIFWQSNTLHGSWKHISSFKGISVNWLPNTTLPMWPVTAQTRSTNRFQKSMALLNFCFYKTATLHTLYSLPYPFLTHVNK